MTPSKSTSEKPGLRAARSAETVARIQEAATRLFVSKGYYGTSLADIAQATNLTKGALYGHFGGKGDLLLSLLRKWEAAFLDPLIREVNGVAGDARAKMRRGHRYAANFTARFPDLCLLYTSVASELSNSGSEFEQELRRIHSKYARFLRRVVEAGKAEGIFERGLDTHTLVYMILAGYDGVLLQWYRNRDLLDGPKFARVSRHVFFHGMLARPSTERGKE